MAHSLCSTHHMFPQIQPAETKLIFVRFAEFLVKNSSQFDNEIVNYGLKVLNDLIRVEFPTNSCRDFLTPFTHFVPMNNETKMEKNLRDIQLYTLVVIVIDRASQLELNKFNLKLKEAAEKFEPEFYEKCTSSFRVDCMTEPLHRLPYARSLVSGKYVTRIFADKANNVYDIFGVKQKEITFDEKTCNLIYSSYKFCFKVPTSLLSSQKQKILFKEVMSRPILSFMYSTYTQAKVLPVEVENAFVSVWKINEAKKAFIGPHSGKGKLPAKIITNDLSVYKTKAEKVTFFFKKQNSQPFFAVHNGLKDHVECIMPKEN